MRGALAMLLAGMLAACGGSSDPAKPTTKKDGGTTAMKEAAAPKPVATITGTIKGMPFVPKGSGSQDSGPQMGNMYPFVKVELTEMNTGACVLDAMADRKLQFWVYNAKDTNEVAPGTYKGMGMGVDTTGTIYPLFHWKDTMNEASDDGMSTITLDAVSQTEIKGSFDVTLVTNGQSLGHLTGTFDTPACN
jgi:hypothetical protein